MASPNVNEIIATTIESRSSTCADNFSRQTALLDHLREGGRMKTFSGGTVIHLPIAFTENSTFGYATGYDTINVGHSEVISAAQYAWTQAYTANTMSGTEELTNNGKEAFLDLWAKKQEIAEQTMMNRMGSDVYGDGTAYGGRAINGLQNLISTTPTTGTIGSINRANFPFWRNVAFSGVTDGGGAVTAANIEAYMEQVVLRITRGTSRPTAIFADNNYWSLFSQSQRAKQRFVTQSGKGPAGAGFATLDFMGIPVMFDGGFGGSCPTNRMYFINSKHLMFMTHSQRNFSRVGGERTPINQDAKTQIMGWAGQMVANNLQLQAVLIP